MFINNLAEAVVKSLWRSLWISFLLYACAGLLFEALFSGVFFQVLHLVRGEPIDWALPCKTYLWSILVYGLSAAVSYTFAFHYVKSFFRLPWAVRGLVYLAGIYLWEYGWGLLIETLTGICPWRYIDSPHAAWRYVNPFFAPVWFLAGLMMERLYRVCGRLWSRLEG